MSSLLAVSHGCWHNMKRWALAASLMVWLFAAGGRQAFSISMGDTGRAISLADYRQHLQALDNLVVACQQQQSACDAAQVGEDERVQVAVGSATETREIRYGWLRLLLERAAKNEEQNSAAVGKLPSGPGKTAATSVPPLTVDALLKQARERLAVDWKQAAGTGEMPLAHTAERKTLDSILLRREYAGLRKPSAKEQLMERLTNWFNEFWQRLVGYGARSPWIAFAFRGVLLAGLLLGLGYGLLRIERRSRIHIVPDSLANSAAPSTREWQLWLQDANAMAERGRWREAVHFVYWASISRLESHRMWPADRARTPREYLALVARLVARDDPRRASLEALTQTFERTWYGGRAADADLFQRSLGWAAALGVE